MKTHACKDPVLMTIFHRCHDGKLNVVLNKVLAYRGRVWNKPKKQAEWEACNKLVNIIQTSITYQDYRKTVKKYAFDD